MPNFVFLYIEFNYLRVPPDMYLVERCHQTCIEEVKKQHRKETSVISHNSGEERTYLISS